MELSKESLNDIVDSLESGFKCFIHLDTGEVVTYMAPDELPDLEYDLWKDDIIKVNTNKTKFKEIEPMESSDNFRIMEEFVDRLNETSIKIKFQKALVGPRPMANFKFQIDNSAGYRDLWFGFKQQKNMEWVLDQLKLEMP